MDEKQKTLKLSPTIIAAIIGAVSMIVVGFLTFCSEIYKVQLPLYSTQKAESKTPTVQTVIAESIPFWSIDEYWDGCSPYDQYVLTDLNKLNFDSASEAYSSFIDEYGYDYRFTLTKYGAVKDLNVMYTVSNNSKQNQTIKISPYMDILIAYKPLYETVYVIKDIDVNSCGGNSGPRDLGDILIGGGAHPNNARYPVEHDNNDYVEIIPGENESFAHHFICNYPGFFEISIQLEITFSGGVETVTLESPIPFYCPETYSVLALSEENQKLIIDKNVVWEYGNRKYYATPIPTPMD